MMRYVVVSRRNLGFYLALVAIGLLLWYGLSKPQEVPTAGVEIHRIQEQPLQPAGTADSAGAGLSDSSAAVPTAGTSQRTGSDLAIEFGLERSRSRSSRAETLAKMIDDPATSQAIRDEAQRRLLRDLDIQTREEEVTRLLEAEGYRDPLVVLNDRGMTITLYGVTLDGPVATRIGELASRMTGVAPDKIVIMERR